MVIPIASMAGMRTRRRRSQHQLVAQSLSVRAARGDHADQAVGLRPRELPSLAAVAAGSLLRRVVRRPAGQIYPGTLEQLQGGFDSTLNLLLGLMGAAALTRLDK